MLILQSPWIEDPIRLWNGLRNIQRLMKPPQSKARESQTGGCY